MSYISPSLPLLTEEDFPLNDKEIQTGEDKQIMDLIRGKTKRCKIMNIIFFLFLSFENMNYGTVEAQTKSL